MRDELQSLHLHWRFAATLYNLNRFEDMIEELDRLPDCLALVAVGANKAPYLQNWQATPLDKVGIRRELQGKRCKAVGVLCGVPSGGLLFLDHDGESCDRLIESLSSQSLGEALPKTVGATSGRPGRYQLIYRVPEQYWEAISNKRISTGTTGEQLEFRWNGCQSVVIGHHPMTGSYRYLPGQSFEECEIAEAPLWMVEQMLLEKPKASNEPPAPGKDDSTPCTLPIDVKVPLYACLGRKNRKLIDNGALEGNRDNAGAALARDLIGTANYLTSIGQPFDGNARELLDTFCSRCTPPLTGKECDRLWRSATKSDPTPCLSPDKIEACIKAWHRKQQSKSTTITAKPALENGSAPKGDPEDEDTDPKAAQQCRQLQNIIGDYIRLNTLTQEIELEGKPIQNLDLLYLQLACDYRIAIGKERCVDIVRKLAFHNPYSPVAEHLKKIAATVEPLPKEDFDRCAERYLGVTDDISQLMLKRTLIAAVARGFNPGCKVDTALILHGPQGFYKSTFFRILGGSWFSDSLGDLRNIKDDLLVLHRYWIHEWGEIEKVTRKREADEIKSFISKTEDDVRPPYGRAAQRLPRSCILTGTTNRREILRDPTGNRRFLIVSIDCPVATDLLQEERDRLWAAAIAAYRAGETWHWKKTEVTTVNERASDYLQQDPWEEPIMKYIDHRSEVTASQLLDECLHIETGRQNRADQMRVTEILRRLGWYKEKRYIDPQTKRKVQRWRPIEDSPQTHLPNAVGPDSNPNGDKVSEDLDTPDPPFPKSRELPDVEPSGPTSESRPLPQNFLQERSSETVSPVCLDEATQAETISIQGIQGLEDVDPPPQAGKAKGGAKRLISGKTRLQYVGQQYECYQGQILVFKERKGNLINCFLPDGSITTWLRLEELELVSERDR